MKTYFMTTVGVHEVVVVALAGMTASTLFHRLLTSCNLVIKLLKIKIIVFIISNHCYSQIYWVCFTSTFSSTLITGFSGCFYSIPWIKFFNSSSLLVILVLSCRIQFHITSYWSLHPLRLIYNNFTL